MNIQDQFGYTEDTSGIWEHSDDALDGTAGERPFVFIDFDTPLDRLESVISRYVESGAGGLIPYLPADNSSADADGSTAVAARRRFYSALLPLAKRAGLLVAFTLDKYLERTWIDAEDALYENATRARVLTAHSYPCSDREEVALTMHDGIHMSVTALHEENGDTVDLRDRVSGDVVTWRAPYGNWTVTEYNCVPDYESRRVNIL